MPHELENDIQDPPIPIDEYILDRIQGSLIGLALGDAVGVRVKFRPHQYLIENPVTDLEGRSIWELQEGQV
jgi:ADP-ribosylglycohydrolase